jgi:hypothetical protein
MTALELVHDLWTAREHACCPYVRYHDERGCWCASPSLREHEDRVLPCDTASLSLWCLTESHYTRCTLYPGGDVP